MTEFTPTVHCEVCWKELTDSEPWAAHLGFDGHFHPTCTTHQPASVTPDPFHNTTKDS